MNGSGLGNFGLGNMGIFGQQQWQKDAREKAFRTSYQQNLQMLGPQAMFDPMLQARARFGAASAMAGASRYGASGSIGGTSPRNIMRDAYGQAAAIGGAGAPNPMETLTNPNNPWYMGMPQLKFPY
jgi:hypothetical protein